jgi:hypothetical protein
MKPWAYIPVATDGHQWVALIAEPEFGPGEFYAFSCDTEEQAQQLIYLATNRGEGGIQ